MSPTRALPAAAAAVLLAFAAAAPAQAQPQIRLLDAITADAGVSYTIIPGSELVIPFTVDKGGKLELRVSPFRGEHGDAVTTAASIDGVTGDARDGRLVFSAVEGEVRNLRLKIPLLSQPGKYSGTLTVLRDGKHQQTGRITFAPATAQRPAAIAADWKTPTIHEGAGAGAAAFSLQLRNTSGEWPANGVFLRLIDVTAPAGRNFDAARNLALQWNGTDAGDLWRSPGDGGTRSIPPNGQAEITGRVRDLAPGEYTVKIGLGAANAPITNDNPITLKLFVRDGIGWPLAVLLLAIVLSFLGTKGLEAQRRRAAALKKIDEIRKGSAGMERYSMPAVAARAFLAQAAARNASWWRSLFGQDTSAALVKKAELLCGILSKSDGVRRKIEAAPWTTMMRHRARKRLTAITGSVNPVTMDDTQAAKVEGELAELKKWLDPAQVDPLYRVDFRGDLDALMAQARPAAFRAHADLIEPLRRQIEPALADAKMDDKARDAFERAYGRLKILWERNRDGDDATLQELGALLKQRPDISPEAFFEAADRAAWSKLQQATFRFVNPPVNDVEPLNKYELIRFEIEPVQNVGNNFLFKHGLKYDWSLELHDGKRFKRLTQDVTTEPRIVQYVPRAGELTVDVKISYKSQEAANSATLPSLPIGKSSDYGFTSAFRVADVGALLVAFLFATITGLTTYYFNNQAFGSVSDYVALFVWGAGVDQTKNFVQHLAQSSGTTT